MNQSIRIVKPYAVKTYRVVGNHPLRSAAHVNGARLKHCGANAGDAALDHAAVLRHYDRDLQRDALLRNIPSSGCEKLNGFIGAVFEDSFVCAAFYERYINRVGMPVLAINLAIDAMKRVQSDPYLSQPEKSVAAIAAFFWQAGYYLQCFKDSQSAGSGPRATQPQEEDRVDVLIRNGAMYYALRALRGKSPGVAALLGAVLNDEGVHSHHPVSINQVTRVRNAVLRSHSV